MELRHLRYFVTVAEELHFGRAARRLHLSQPPLSMQIKALEAEVGAVLLARSRRRVELTPAGAVFLDEAREILARVNHAAAAARRADRGEIGELSIGFISIADYNVLPLTLSEFRSQHPGVRLNLRELTTDTQLQDLLAQRIDVGFMLAPVQETLLASEALLREPLVAALAKRHPLARSRGRLKLANLADSPFILFPRHMAPGLYDAIVSFCRQTGFSPRVEQEAVQMQTIISLVSAQLGVALIPASMRNLGRAGVVYRELQEKSPLTELVIAWRMGETSPALVRFLESTRKVAARLTGRSRGANWRSR
ncbi:MAG: LysR family transcriptional regulator [Proteobacteria bacterium]|nr:MAG: LysR family transcriptional regulator [Pseudomonadota bacterium]